MIDSNGDYIFYADESGDHSLTSIDITYPVFSLSLCAFRKKSYCNKIIPQFQRLKFNYFGHDSIVLHEHEIRKQVNAFRFLKDERSRNTFINDLSECLEKSSFRIFSCVIMKQQIKSDLFPENPYSLSLRICLQNAYIFLEKRSQQNKKTHFIFEKRGQKEDTELELEFRRLVAGKNDLKIPLSGFDIHFSDKRCNSTGMQIADLTARPLGLSVLRPYQTNRAFEIIRHKIYKNPRRVRLTQGIFIP
jgi:Protein of unknown function (DUF3800)